MQLQCFLKESEKRELILDNPYEHLLGRYKITSVCHLKVVSTDACFLYIRVGGLGHTASSIKMVLSPSLVLDGQLVVQPQLPLHAILVVDGQHENT